MKHLTRQRFNRLCSLIRFVLILWPVLLLTGTARAQFTTTWALTSNKTVTSHTGAQAASALPGDMVPGSQFPNPGAHNTDGYRCQISSGNWPTAPTDGYHIDFPYSPAAGFDLTLTGITFRARTSGSSGNNIASLAYQADGAGPFVPFGTPQTVVSGGSSNISFAPLSQQLFNGHTYIIRLYIYAAGTTTSSRNVFIRTMVFDGTAAAAGTPPTVTTDAANATGKYTALILGTITAGTQPVSTSGVCWGLSANPDVSGPGVTTNGPAAGSIGNGTGGNISGLSAGTTYHARAYATTAAGTFYGADLSFTTDAPSAPVLTTVDPAGFPILARRASSGGNFSDSGGVAITRKGVCWSTSPTPTLADNFTSDGQFALNYGSSLTGLQPATQYYVRAYAINSVDTGYGNIISFTTAPQTTELIVDPASLAFGNVPINTQSPALSFNLSGYVLSPAASNISITAPAGFLVSTSANSGFAASISIPYTNGTLDPAIRIYVKAAPANYGPLSGTLTVSGGGAADQSIALTAYGVQSPGDFSNRGTDFWVGYATHNLMYSNATNMASDGGDQTMVLYFTSDIDAVVSVTVPGLGETIVSGLPVPANTVQSVVVPKSPGSTLPPFSKQLYREGLFNSAIHISSDNGVPVVAYAHIYGNLVSGASLLLPSNTWGTQYYAISAPQLTSSGSSSGSYNYFFVVAKDDNTVVEITPTVTTTGGLLPGQTTTVTLNRGQIYNVLASKVGGEDVTGSFIKSTDCTKKIAVFSGSGRVGIPSSCSSSPSSDNLFQQVFPSVVWGTKYLTSRTAGTLPDNMFRVCVKDPATNVTVNGQPISTAYPTAVLTNNFFYEFRDSLPLKIEADKPILVAQYTQSVQGCTRNGLNVNGDPEMILISPVQQSIKNVTLYSPSNQDIAFPYVNVIIPKACVSNFTVEGVNRSSLFVQHPQDTGYAYATLTEADGITLNGSVTLNADLGFTAIAYGFGNAAAGGSDPRRESYGYNAGTQLNDLGAPLLLQNPYGGPINSATQQVSTCRGTTFRLSATLPYQTKRISFAFLGNPNISPNNDTTLEATSGNLPFDSSFVLNGITYYVYRLATPYVFSAVGDYTVQVTSFNPVGGEGGCLGGSDRTINYSIKVTEGVSADFDIDYNSCRSDTVRLTDRSNGLGYTITKWLWSYNNGATALPAPQDTIQHPVLLNPADNTARNYSLRAINNIGCFADRTKQLPVAVIPTVSLSAFSDVCTTSPAFTLSGGSPTTGGVGVYSGTGVSGGSFNPATAGAGTHAIKYVFTTDLGCKDSATQNITVSLAATLSINPVPALCADAAAVTLVANVPGGVFSGPGVSEGSFSPAAAGVGTYAIGYSLPGNSCSVPASLTVTVNPVPTGFSAGDDVEGIFGRSATINGSGPAEYSYLWSPASFLNSTSTLVTTSTATESTTYTLTATNSFGCTAKDEMVLTVSRLCIDPPNVFTPNGDGFYDKWVVINGSCTRVVKVSVFNRWGGKVYENDRYTNEWDGTYKGKALPDGTYYYIVEARLNNGEAMVFRGNVTIMR